MRRWFRFGLAGVACLATLAVLAGALAAVTFDPNTQKDRIIEAVRRATGRDLVLAGPLRLIWGLSPTLAVEDAALANAPGGSRPQMATVARLAAQVALWPLLSGRIEIASVTLDRPDILLEIDAQGAGNWQFRRPISAGPAVDDPAGAAPSQPRMAVAVRRLTVVNGRIAWRDGSTGRTTVIDVPRATLTLDPGGHHLVADGQSAGQALHLDGVVVPRGTTAWPVKLAVDAAGARLVLDGTAAWPLSPRSFHGRVDAAVPDLAAVSGLLKLPDLPPLHDLHLGMQLGGDDGLEPAAVSLQIGPSSLAWVRPDLTLRAIDLTLPAPGQPGRLVAEGTDAAGTWRLASGVVATRQAVALRALSLAAPAGDVAGDVTISRPERWTVRGTLVSQSLDVDALRTPGRPAAAAAMPPAGQAPPQPARLFSDAVLPWERLRAADADLHLTIASVRSAGMEYRGLDTRLLLQSGALHLDPFTVRALDGRIDGSLALDASPAEPVVALALHAPSLGLGPLLQTTGLPGGSAGMLEGDAELRSTGLSLHALAARLDGHAALAMVDGTVDNAVLAVALGRIVPAAGRLAGSGSSPVRCLALRLDATSGQVGISALTVDSARLSLQGTGTLDLARETLALRLRPSLRLGGTALLAPVRVDGSLAQPLAALDAPGGEGQPGIVIGGAVPDECPAALAAARDGRPGPLPGAAPARAIKPADLLRSLLR